MSLSKKKKFMMLIVLPVALVVLLLLASRIFFRESRISDELNRLGCMLESDVPMETFAARNIVDYDDHWSGIYAKLELTAKEYEQFKHMLLESQDTRTNKDFADEIMSETSRYNYNPSIYRTMLNVMDNVRRRRGYLSMNLDDCEEIIMIDILYGKWFSSGFTVYVLVKESSNNHYLYIYSG